MCDEELFSAKEIQRLQDVAFLEGALAACGVISTLIDDAKKQDNHSIAATLEKRIDNLGFSLVSAHVENLQSKLKLKAWIPEADLTMTEQPEGKTQQTAPSEVQQTQ